MKHKYILFLIFILIACHSKKSNKQEQDIDESNKSSNNVNIVISDSLQVIKTLFVTDKSGLEMKDAPSLTAKKIGNFKFGDKLEVVEEKGDWLGVKKDEVLENKSTQTITHHKTKVYVLKKGTIDIAAKQIRQEELNMVSALHANGVDKESGKSFALIQYVKLSLVDEATYLKQQKISISLFLDDSKSNAKLNGITSLATKKGTKKYVDRPNAGDNSVAYNYVGQYPGLNYYVVEAVYYENRNFIILDRNTGKESAPFCEFPMLSPDKKFIACVLENMYDGTADFELYRIEQTSPKPFLKTSFVNWLPVNKGTHELFWGSDNAIYAKVCHPQVCSITQGKEYAKHQYLRIQLMGQGF